MPFLDIHHSRFYYEMEGVASAPVVMLSNSLGTNLRMWNAQIPDLVRKFGVLRYDTRGHGQSSVSPGPYSVEQLVDDAVGLLDALRISVVSFCGLSLGGMIGLSLALRAPHRLHKLILCNTAPKIGTADAWNSRIAAVQKGGMSAVADAVLQRWYTPQFFQRAPKTVAETREMLLLTATEGYAACCAAVRDMDQRAAIRQIRVPTLVIAGGHDPVTTPADAQSIVDSIPGAQSVELPAAHLSNVEAAEEFTASMLCFLKG
jgi:3-oxoadipate enol-lactonase